VELDRQLPPHGWDIYILAGVATMPGFFEPFRHALLRRFEACGLRASVRVVFPYGDFTESVASQLRQVRGDMSGRPKAWRVGGKRTAERVRADGSRRPAVFIGHSGGGAAGYQAALILSEEGTIPDWRVVQIGSPKMRILPEHRDRVSYFYGVDGSGRVSDPITRIGSWGGFRRGRAGLWYWDRLRFAPGHIAPIRMIGGHPHYFRERAPYIDPVHGSNLDRTLNAVWGRLPESAERSFTR